MSYRRASTRKEAAKLLRDACCSAALERRLQLHLHSSASPVDLCCSLTEEPGPSSMRKRDWRWPYAKEVFELQRRALGPQWLSHASCRAVDHDGS